jgi:glutamine cyclotransferase
MPKNFILTSLILFSIALSSSSCVQQAQTEPKTESQNPGAIAQNTTQNTDNVTNNIPTQGYRIMKTYPHDNQAFTQGLVYHQGVLYEGTGLRGRSSLRKVELETGKVLQIHQLPDQYFGEGIVIWQDKIIQLTWQSQVGFVYDRETFEQVGEFNYPTEGWGITHDGEKLIMSDGTDTLFFLDPETFQEIGRIQVRYGNQPVRQLNELEYINGEVFANVWMTDLIVRIDPETGEILGAIDLTGLYYPDAQYKGNDVLNGIAYDPEADRLFVTGKLWPNLYEIELVP